MLEKILYPTDFSDYAWRTFQRIDKMRVCSIKEVILVHVVDLKTAGGLAGKLQEHAKSRLNEHATHLEREGLRTKIYAPIGNPNTELIRIAEEEDVSLILMGARGKGLIREAFLGSTSSYVLRKSKKPVLIMRHKVVEELGKKKCEKICENIFERILLPTDFSEYAEGALAFIKELKYAGTKEIILVHVVEGGETAEQIESLKEEAKLKLQDMKDKLRRKGLRIKVHLHVGMPSKEIMKIAGEEKISLIIMGARGKSMIEELLIGSTTEDVVRRAPTPVLVIKK